MNSNSAIFWEKFQTVGFESPKPANEGVIEILALFISRAIWICIAGLVCCLGLFVFWLIERFVMIAPNWLLAVILSAITSAMVARMTYSALIHRWWQRHDEIPGSTPGELLSEYPGLDIAYRLAGRSYTVRRRETPRLVRLCLNVTLTLALRLRISRLEREATVTSPWLRCQLAEIHYLLTVLHTF